MEATRKVREGLQRVTLLDIEGTGGGIERCKKMWNSRKLVT